MLPGGMVPALQLPALRGADSSTSSSAAADSAVMSSAAASSVMGGSSSVAATAATSLHASRRMRDLQGDEMASDSDGGDDPLFNEFGSGRDLDMEDEDELDAMFAQMGVGPAHSAASATHHAAHPTASASALLAQRRAAKVQHGGVFSTYKSQSAIRASLKRAAAERHIAAVSQSLQALNQHVDVLRTQVENEQQRTRALESKLESLRSELTSGVSTLRDLASRRSRAMQLVSLIASTEEELKHQRTLETRTRAELKEKDRERDQVQLQWVELAPVRELMTTQAEEEGGEMALLAQASALHAQKQKKRARKLELQRQQAEAAQAEEKKVEDDIAHQKLEEQRARHAAELSQTNEAVKAREEQLAQQMREIEQRREEAKKQLEASTAEAHNLMRAAHERRQKRLAAREKGRAEERARLESMGKNADAIFLARDEEQRQKLQMERLKQEQKARDEQLRIQLQREGEKVLKLDREKRKEVLVKEEYARKVGRSMIDVRAAEIEARKQAREERRKNEEALRVAELDAKRFVPEDTSEPDEEETNAHDAAATSHGVGGLATLSTSAAASPLGGDSSDDDMGPPPGDSTFLSPKALKHASKPRVEGAEYNEWGLRIIPNHSNPYREALDKRKINRALEAQKESIARGHELKVRGLVCKKSAYFLPKPLMVIFEDFRVGTEMEKRLELTNVSDTFNRFKILDMDDAVRDFFEIKYEPVGRMSAGSTATMTIIFRPKLNEDIETVIPFLAETGPFAVPIRCRTRKAHIDVESANPPKLIKPKNRTAASGGGSGEVELDVLDMGVVVLGDSSRGHFLIHNRGATGVDFRIKHLPRKKPSIRKKGIDGMGNQGGSGAVGELSGEFEEKMQISDNDGLSAFGSTNPDVKPLNLTGLIPSSVPPPMVGDGSAAPAGSSPSDPITSLIHDPPNFHDSAEEAAQRMQEAQLKIAESFDDYLRPLNGWSGRVDGYSTIRWEAEFKPQVEGEWEHEFVVTFGPPPYPDEEDEEGSNASTQQQEEEKQQESRPFDPFEWRKEPPPKFQEPIHWSSPRVFYVRIRGAGSSVPIYLDESILDMQTVCFDKIYRMELTLKNRHSTAHKFVVHYPTPRQLAPPRRKDASEEENETDPLSGASILKVLASQLEFTPKVGYIQAYSSYAIQVKLTPSEELWKALKYVSLKHSSPPGSLVERHHTAGHIFLPLQIEAQDQTLPVLWSLTARMVNPHLEITPDVTRKGKVIDFGKVLTNESKAFTITVKNRSPLLQKIAPFHLDEEIKVEPNDGMIVIPPFRSAELNIIFSPSAAIDYSSHVELRTKLGDTIRLPYKARGVIPKVSCSSSSIHFPATPNFNHVFATTWVKNSSKNWKHTVEVVWDDPADTESHETRNSMHSKASFLHVYPRTFELEAFEEEESHTNRPGSPPMSSRSQQQQRATKPAKHQQRVEIEFRPELNLKELYEDIGIGAATEREEGEGDGAGEQIQIVLSTQEERVEEEKEGEAGKRSKPDSTPARRGGKSKKAAEAEAEQARLAAEQEAAEEQRRQIEAAAAAQAAALEEEDAVEDSPWKWRDDLDALRRVQSRNTTPQPHLVDFADEMLVRKEEPPKLGPDEVKANKMSTRKTGKKKTQRGGQQKGDGNEYGGSMDMYVENGDESMDSVPVPFAPSNPTTILEEDEEEEVEDRPVGAEDVFHAEPWSRHARHRLALYIRSEHIVRGAIEHSVQFLEVKTCLILPALEAHPKVLEFGQVALGGSATRSIEVRNVSPYPLHLAMEAFSYASNFRVCNALRAVQPGEVQIVVVEFRPRREGKRFKQDLVLKARKPYEHIQVTVPLVARCMRPDVRIITHNEEEAEEKKDYITPAPKPLDSSIPLLHLGDVVVNETIRRTLLLENRSEYPYSFRIIQENPDAVAAAATASTGSSLVGGADTIIHSTHNLLPGSPPEFFCVPSSGTLGANGGTQRITLHFTPTSISLFYPYRTTIVVGNTKLRIEANVHETPLFVSGAREGALVETKQQRSVSDDDVNEGAPNAATVPSSFKDHSLLSGFSVLGDDLAYQHALAFLDGSDALYASVGGASTAQSFPLFAVPDNNVWEALPDPTDGSAANVANEADDAQAGKSGAAGRKGGKGKENKRGSGGAGTAATKKDGGVAEQKDVRARPMLSDGAAPVPRQLELTFDPSRTVERSSVLGASAAASSKAGRGKTAASNDTSASSPSSLVLIESLYVGQCTPAVMIHDPLASTGTPAQTTTSTKSNEKSSEKESIGSYEITIHPVNAPASTLSASTASASSASSSSSSDSSLLSLFSVEPSSSGALRPGSKELIHFLFDYSSYQAQKDADGVRRVLSVGQWVEALAKVTLKHGPATGSTAAPAQVIEVKLRVYLD